MKKLFLTVAVAASCAFAWGNKITIDSTGNVVMNSAPAQKMEYTIIPDERFYRMQKCANLLAEISYYNERYQYDDRYKSNSRRDKYWEKMNQLQPLIDRYCEHE